MSEPVTELSESADWTLSQELVNHLIAETRCAVYDDAVPAEPDYPYTFTDFSFPLVAERSMTRSVHSTEVALRTTIAASNKQSLLILCARVNAALEGATVTAEGWRPMRFESEPNGQRIDYDLEAVIPGTSKHPLYIVLDWKATAVRK